MTNHRYRLATATALSMAGAVLASTAVFAGVFARPTLFSMLAVVTVAAVLLAIAAGFAEGSMFQAVPLSVLVFLPAVAVVAAIAAPQLASAHTHRQVTDLLAATALTSPTSEGIHSAVLSAGAVGPVVNEVSAGHFVVSFQMEDAGPTLSRTTVCVTAHYSPTATTIDSITEADADGDC